MVDICRTSTHALQNTSIAIERPRTWRKSGSSSRDLRAYSTNQRHMAETCHNSYRSRSGQNPASIMKHGTCQNARSFSVVVRLKFGHLLSASPVNLLSQSSISSLPTLKPPNIQASNKPPNLQASKPPSFRTSKLPALQYGHRACSS